MRAAGWRLVNADCVLVGEEPRIAPHREEMRRRLQEAIGEGEVNVRATTTDRLGFTGRGEGLAAHAVALLERRYSAAWPSGPTSACAATWPSRFSRAQTGSVGFPRASIATSPSRASDATASASSGGSPRRDRAQRAARRCRNEPSNGDCLRSGS